VINKNIHKDHGTINTLEMESKIPHDGTHNSSNNNHINIPIEENSLCGQEPTKSDLDTPSVSNVDIDNQKKENGDKDIPDNKWDYKIIISQLRESTYKDYMIIGYYFYFKGWAFEDEDNFKMEFNRVLKPANKLKGYNMTDILNTMEWCENEYGYDMGWVLDTIVKTIDDCISTDFIPNGKERDRLLNIINI